MTFRKAALIAAMLLTAVGTSADAQQRYYGHRSGGFFDQLFGGGRGGGGGFYPNERQFGEPQTSVDSSRAPAPKKSDTTPTLSIVVLGDSTADWLAYGLEEAFTDAPEIAISRKAKTHSGLIRYEARSDLDWWRVARDLLGKEKADYVVMMIGVNDRQSIRESAADKKAREQAKEPAKEQKQNETQQTQKPEDDEAIVTPEPSRGGGTAAEFRSERWEAIYTKRIDETIAALKSKGVPVLWVGLPPIRGTRSTADTQYLNQLYRARAEAQGVLFVDVWDGFVDEGGKFTYQGPDFEGQTRRLRAGDGVHFTKQGARKLAHYVERELRRFMSNRSMPMAMPSPGTSGPATPSEPAARPVAGPVVPLTSAPGSGEELLGGRSNSPVHADATATRVLVKGEPVPAVAGRADDFQWPRAGDASAAVEPLSPTAAAARAEPAAPPRGARKGTQEATRGSNANPADKPAEKRDQAATQRRTSGTANAEQRPRPQQRVQQQPPPEPRRNTGIFGGLFR